MDDRTHDGTAPLAALANAGPWRWHAAPGGTPADRTLVLDDGTGDVELRLRTAEGRLDAALVICDVELDRFEQPATAGVTSEADAVAFTEWMNAAIARHVPDGAEQSGPAKGRSRFIVSFSAAQLAGLRERAERERVPVAEVVRRAVDAFLAGSEVRPGPADS
jgi:hypothetical protein